MSKGQLGPFFCRCYRQSETVFFPRRQRPFMSTRGSTVDLPFIDAPVSDAEIANARWLVLREMRCGCMSTFPSVVGENHGLESFGKEVPGSRQAAHARDAELACLATATSAVRALGVLRLKCAASDTCVPSNAQSRADRRSAIANAKRQRDQVTFAQLLGDLDKEEQSVSRTVAALKTATGGPR